ncbi:hypothetical protein BTH42_14025 [Burkholderia sp. SRS-W-2-2016]|uniref:hypothetical protein n=1 Tax=Burkholderia sp. SRS-W-2-2016 TaxID=1926878 RepID=UPI00094B77A0|nr:hypothetical protein [Burkholderia sp. SRS-W-2-2016]OLL30897.1 hypothetical protein BTH42_14025 [Burkholderia sp. SRS-W-2-2016]
MSSTHVETGLPMTPLQSADHHRLIVRAGTQRIRIAAIWQVLLPFSGNVEKVDIKTLPADGFDQATIALRHTPRESLDHIVTRFNDMSWVTSTTLC